MPDLAVPKAYDAYGHPNDAWTQGYAGYTATSSGSSPGTVVNPGTADPSGTSNVAPPNCVSDAYGQFQITVKGTKSTGALRNIYFQKKYPVVRPVLVAISTNTSTPTSAGGTLTIRMYLDHLAISVGTGLGTGTTSGPTFNISYVIL